jgi:nucleotide-binding universal stress UspA family protein
MVKDIVVKLETGPRDPAGDYAISMAESLRAHLVGLAFAYEPGLPGYVMAEMPPDLVAKMMAEREQQARAALERFERAANPSVASFEPRLCQSLEQGAPELFSRLARRLDLSVAMQSEPEGADNNSLIEAALFDSGRPVCIVPYIQREEMKLNRLVCCWDGSRAAARAFNDALPLLAKAAAVDLLIVLTEKTRTEGQEIHGVEMAKHLARHDVNVTIETTPAADIDVASAILSYVADAGATMIVMGGYGHSRLREFVLGGVTRDILSSMTVPVFMSH